MTLMRPRNIALILVGFAGLLFAAFIFYKMLQPDPFDTGAPLLVNDAREDRIALVGDNLALDNLPPGWVHRTFWNVTPTNYRLTTIDGRSALHCATDNSGSILARDTDISLAEFPILSWDWKIEEPLVSAIDEETSEGDDHPARFFVRFANAVGSSTAAEIIWSNTRFKPGDYKIIDGFHHLVANGLNENVGKWHSQSVDLEALYRQLPNSNGSPTLTLLGFFCDSDNTGGSTSAFFSDVHLERRPG